MKTQVKNQLCDDLNLTSITVSQQIIIIQHAITSAMFNLREYVRAAFIPNSNPIPIWIFFSWLLLLKNPFYV